MAKLIIHLGYPKTGTTYLQRKIFTQLPEGFVLITPESENIGLNIRRFKHLIQEGECPKGLNKKLSGKDVLISIEGWLFDPMRNVSNGSFKPVSFSKALEGLNLLSSEFRREDISIVLCLRRQDHLLHSLYAESKTFHFNQCERLNTLEKYVNAVLQEDKDPQQPGYYYDFNHTIEEIKSAFPDSDLQVRFFENLENNLEGEINFWSEILNFTLIAPVGKENARNLGVGVKVADSNGWLRFHALRIKSKYAPSLKLPNQLSRLIKKLLIQTTSSEKERIILSDDMSVKLCKKYQYLNNKGAVADCIPTCLKSTYLEVMNSDSKIQSNVVEKV